MHRNPSTLLLSLLLIVSFGTRAFAGPNPEPAERSEAYRAGREALDAGEWRHAEELFRPIARQGGAEADAATYWIAYALHKQGREQEARASLDRLRAEYPDSPWRDDAEALAVEIEGTDPDQIADEELKLYALNSLVHVDPERALPILERFLEADHSPRLERQALFVLSQSRTPEARRLLADIATGTSHPELQREAVQHLALSGDAESRALLETIYRSTSSVAVKRSVLESFMASGDREHLLTVAREESDGPLKRRAIELLGAAGAGEELEQLYRDAPSTEGKMAILEGLMVANRRDAVRRIAMSDPEPALRRQAVEYLGVMHGGQELRELYSTAQSPELKAQILSAFMVGGDVEALADAARSETDPALRRKAIENLGVSGRSRAGEVLLDLYPDSDAATKQEIIEALAIQNNAEGLISLLEAETDPVLRRRGLRALSQMSSDAAADYLLEALEEPPTG